MSLLNLCKFCLMLPMSYELAAFSRRKHAWRHEEFFCWSESVFIYFNKVDANEYEFF